ALTFEVIEDRAQGRAQEALGLHVERRREFLAVAKHVASGGDVAQINAPDARAAEGFLHLAELGRRDGEFPGGGEEFDGSLLSIGDVEQGVGRLALFEAHVTEEESSYQEVTF